MSRDDAQLSQRPRVGLALSGGVARGFAHIGVLRVLEEHNIPVDYIAGTSAGSLVAAAYAAGMSVDEVANVSRGMRWKDVGRVTLSRLGVQSNARLEEFVRAHLPVKRFEDLRVPLAIVATDLKTGSAVIMTEGDVAFAVRASCALPGWYVPVTDDHGRQLVDGGLVANIPTAAVRALGADLVIAVDVNCEGAKFIGPPHSVIGVILQSMMVIQRTAAIHQLHDADVVVMPKTGHIRWDEMQRADDLIQLGEQAARSCVERIKHLLEPVKEPPRKWYQRRRRQQQALEDKRRVSPLR
ncbi:MAG TPA: patatin-like phospholipase family protein [Pyrinomonadaceae bacterium]|nr:patatin-like phospholipase family protein [Pyrinomonadaceae bacterium]